MYRIKNHPNLSFKLINNISGWLVFGIAAVTYLLTIEPTASLWDCGEFIATSVGLQVGHPPGAPLFMIISRLFAMLTSDPAKHGVMINAMSALASAFTILFLFWTISHMARKLIIGNAEEGSLGDTIAIIGASTVGALAYTFSDTFWFSAVEAEVYALSSLFTALVFWAILKWENIADQPHSNRWLVLIAYLMGLSIGVHLLNLLAIPAIVFIYYFKKYTPTLKGIVKTALLSVFILGFVNFFMIPYFIKIGGWFELLFVNGLGFHFNTGVIIYVFLLITGLAWGISYTFKKNKAVLNTVLTCVVMILIGYSSYSMVVIRSLADPPIDENSPDNVFSLLRYIEREQYGQSPLFYGQYYNAPRLNSISKDAYYPNRKTGKYDKISIVKNYEFDPRFMTVFPRMHSQRDYHPQIYEMWAGAPSGPLINVNGENIRKPSFGNNLKFFFNYQVKHMYWRYFMWNFAGRQNDIQGLGDNMNGNWISGIPFIDNMMLGNQSELPDTYKNNKARNKYYLLPFILGILGMVFQYRKNQKGKQDFWVVCILFFMTGLAIILFLNQAPNEPRERDYAYAGSFYAFAVWIGLGVLWLWDKMRRHMPESRSALLASIVALIAVPANMAAENWDDHDRSGRYATIANAKNYLNSCAPNAILFSYGDNDTFPIWYAQEVEGIRRDIRLVNLSLLAGGWYIDQMKRMAYESPGVPISLTQDQYGEGKREGIVILDELESLNIKEAVKFVASDDIRTKRKLLYGEDAINYIPTRTLILPVDSAKVINSGLVSREDADKILKEIKIELKGNVINKSEFEVLDIIATNNWERPIYFGVGMGRNSYMGLEDYFQLEGVTYKFVPIKTPKTKGSDDFGRINSSILYDNLMNKFEWGNIKNPKVNMDFFHRNNIGVMKYRNTFLRLAEKLFEEGKKEKALEVLNKSLEELPVSQIGSDSYLLYYIPLLYELKANEKANDLIEILARESYQNIRYVLSLKPSKRGFTTPDINKELQITQLLIQLSYGAEEKELAERIKNETEALLGQTVFQFPKENKTEK